jgi:hypothetical protein
MSMIGNDRRISAAALDALRATPETDPAEGPPGAVRLVRRLELPDHGRMALAARVSRGVGV